MTMYLLPCACSATIEIGAGQAGGTVVCPACGRPVAVPKLRDLKALRTADSGRAGPHRGGWSLPHASMLAGAAVAALAWTAAAYFAAARNPLIDGDTIRAAVAAADDASIREAWKSLSRSGVARQPTPEERHAQRTMRFRRGAAAGLAVIGAVGALAMIGGAIVMAATRKAAP